MTANAIRRGRVAAVIVATLAVVSPAAANAATERPRLDEAKWGSLQSDGERHIAYVLPDGRLRVIDDGAGGASFEVAVPDGCIPDGRTFAVGGSQLVVRCWDASTVPGRPPATAKRLDLATRTWHDVPGADAWSSGEDGRPDLLFLEGVGERWIAYRQFDGEMAWADWRSGTVRDDDGRPGDVPDLDAARLFEPMCAPLERPLPRSPLAPMAFTPTFYERPFAVARHADFALTLQSCGSPRMTVVGWTIDVPQLGGGVVTWQSTGDVVERSHALLAACRVRLSWAAPTEIVWTRHVRGAVYRLLGDIAVGRAYVERIPLPTRCPRAPRLTAGAGRGNAVDVAASRWSGAGAPADTAERVPRPGAAAPALAAGSAAVVVHASASVRAVRWRLSARAGWHAARPLAGRAGRWWIGVPRRAGVHPVTIELRDRSGLVSEHTLSVRRTAARR
ncbi:hypothetical protein [Conexibacter woesei]|nr:hypothetical protein [Conexibacter woesei]